MRIMDQRIPSYSPMVKGGLADAHRLGFQTEIADLCLKCGIPREDLQNKSSGRNIAWKGPKNPLKMTGRVQNPAGRYPKDH
jgi:hypothetical protein